MLIAQISDLHVGGHRYERELLDRAVEEINEAGPDLLVVAGDLTEDGYPEQHAEAAEAIGACEAPLRVIVPGNHDARHVGYLWFEEVFGDRETRLRPTTIAGLDVALVAVDSSKPDLDEGEVGRERYGWIAEGLAGDPELRIVVCHHHLVPIPGTGREANQIRDAGDVLALLRRAGADLVLGGHRHVPWVWPIGGMLLVNSGTVSTHRARAFRDPSYNLVEVNREHIRAELRVPGGRRQPLGTYPRAWPAELAAGAAAQLERNWPGRLMG